MVKITNKIDWSNNKDLIQIRINYNPVMKNMEEQMSLHQRNN